MSNRYDTGFVFLLNILWLCDGRKKISGFKYLKIVFRLYIYNLIVQRLSLPCSVIKRDGCCARRCIQSLLRTSVQDVNLFKHTQVQLHTCTLNNRECCFFVIFILCLSINIDAAPSEATVSTRKRQLCLWEMDQ